MTQIKILFGIMFLVLTALFLSSCTTSSADLNKQLDSITNYQYSYQTDDTLYNLKTNGSDYSFEIKSSDQILNGFKTELGIYLSYNGEKYTFIGKDSSYHDIFLDDLILIDIFSLYDLTFDVVQDVYQTDQSDVLVKNQIIKNLKITISDELINNFSFYIDQSQVSIGFQILENFELLLPDNTDIFLPKSFDDNQSIGSLLTISKAFVVSISNDYLVLSTPNNHAIILNSFDISNLRDFDQHDEIILAHKTINNTLHVQSVLNVKSGVTHSFESKKLTDLSNGINIADIGSLADLAAINITNKTNAKLVFTVSNKTFEILFTSDYHLLINDIFIQSIYDFSNLIVIDENTFLFSNHSEFNPVISNNAPFIATDLDNVKTMSENYNVSTGLPSIGNPKVLVLPISFTDYTAPYDMVINLETALFGDKSQTGYHSLTSFYNQSSYGKLNIDGAVLQPYQASKKSSSYERSYENGNDSVDYELLELALSYHNASTDYSDFDSDGDGYIDAIIMVYTAPVSFNSGSDLWWAYTYQYESSPVKYYDNVLPDYYVFMGYDFLSEKVNESQDLDLNALTFIHETGHLLGLDDYYDYDLDKGPAGGIGGGDMMDSTVGDHNPFSKLLLGWITPTIITPYDVTISLKPFQTSGEAIIIPKLYNGTIFDEYLIIDFYTPTGLNELQSGYSGLFNVPGIRIYHVSASLNSNADIYNMWSLPKDNNSDSRNKLLKLLEADGDNNIENTTYSNYGEYSENSDLFTVGKMLENYTWYDGSPVNFTIIVTEVNDTEAFITIDYN